MNKQKLNREVFEHLPFTFFGASVSIVLLAVVQSLRGDYSDHENVMKFFHIFHFFHLLLSALTSTAMSFRVKQAPIRAAIIGIATTVPFCVTSDALIPFVGGFILRVPMKLHICAIQEPLMVFSSLIIGALGGVILEKKIGKVTYLSHSAHVMVSSFASLFYLVGFGLDNWIKMLGPVFFITVIAVIIPCCLSDIIFPISLTHAEHDHPHT